jgi:cysteinyl-tRNA synthetase
MSIDFLDKHVDIHVGGIDLRFPHHENERAQSNSITATEVVDTWVHGEHLLFEGRKMSKSAGNVVLLGDVIARNLDPLALRFSLMENRYRSQMDLSWAALEASHATLKRWRNQLSQWGTSLEIKIDAEITDALTQDLDTPRAMQRLRSVEKDMTIGAQDKRAIFLYADLVLALDLQRAPDNKPLTKQLEELLDLRAKSRAEKNWQKSDELRLQLESQGLEISDGPTGQSWSWK